MENCIRSVVGVIIGVVVEEGKEAVKVGMLFYEALFESFVDIVWFVID